MHQIDFSVPTASYPVINIQGKLVNLLKGTQLRVTISPTNKPTSFHISSRDLPILDHKHDLCLVPSYKHEYAWFGHISMNMLGSGS